MPDLEGFLSRFPKEERLAYLDALETKRKSENYIKYWMPNSPGQWEAIRAFQQSIKVMCVRGGNRSGKSSLGAAITIAWALGKEYFQNEPAWEWVQNLPIPEKQNNIWVVGLDFSVVRDVLWGEKFTRGGSHPALLPKDDEVIEKKSEGDFWIQFKNGSRITCKSADSGPEKFQSASVDLIWIDEECDESIFNECYQRTVDCRGKILTTLTPLADISSGNKVPWVFNLYEDFQGGKTKDVAFISLSVLDNPSVPPEEKQNLQEKWAGHVEERARLYGEFIQRAGLVYPMWNPKRHLVKPFQIPRSWFKISCIDPAPTGPTGCIWAAVEPGTENLFFYREYEEPDKIVSDHAADIILRSMGDKVDTWLIDPKGGSQRNAETHKSIAQLYKDSGIPVRLADLPEDYGIAALGEYLQATTVFESRHPKLFIFENLTRFSWEMSRYTWAFYGRGDMKGLAKEKPVKKNDHLINCAQYLAAYRPRSRARIQLMNPDQQKEFAKVNSYT